MPSYATNLPDLVKLALIAWLMIYLINSGLRRIGLASYTTKGA